VAVWYATFYCQQDKPILIDVMILKTSKTILKWTNDLY